MGFLKKSFPFSLFFEKLSFLLVLCIAAPSLAETINGEVSNEKSTETLQVVATFSILADMVEQIGGRYVDVHSLVGWEEDAHVFQPSPDQVRKIAESDLLVLNGLGFEGWLARLVSAANYNGPSVVATKGIDLIRLNLHQGVHDHHEVGKSGVYDPHAWHSLRSALVYISNITDALVNIDREHAQYYLENKADYEKKIKDLDFRIQSQLSRVPDSHKRIVVPHNAFAYLARDYGLYIHSLQGISTESEASAADLAKIVRLIRSFNITAIFTENISDKRLIRVVESETNAKIEGALVSGALSRKLAPSYLEMMEYNSQLIIKALTKE